MDTLYTLTEMTEHIVSSSGSARASEHPLISPLLVLDLPLVLQLELDMGTKGNSNLPWEIFDTSGQMKTIFWSCEFIDPLLVILNLNT